MPKAASGQTIGCVESTPNRKAEPAQQAHWDGIYERLKPSGVSWYEPEASMSLELIKLLPLPTSAKVIEVGGGASCLVDGLLARGFSDITVLDLSDFALRTARDRVGRASATWLHCDLLAWRPDCRYLLWHDRAVYHFLTEERDRSTYRALLGQSVAEGGYVIVASFAPDGPERCSGLPVARYGVEELSASLGSDFELVNSCRDNHVTPKGVVQPFTWVVARRTGTAG